MKVKKESEKGRKANSIKAHFIISKKNFDFYFHY